MSRFVDLDDLLRAKEEEKQHEAEFRKRTEASRTVHDPLLHRAFDVFKDFWQTVLLPRKPLNAIAKKKEEIPTDVKKRTNLDPYFHYLVSLIPADRLPVQDGEYLWMEPDINGFDWHPNVALQFTARLHDTYDHRAKQYTGNLKPEFVIKAWGIVRPEQNSVLPSNMRIGHENAFYLNYTYIWIDCDSPIQEIESSLIHAFTLLTPLVLNHSQTVRH